MKKIILLFTKYPDPGKCKTRLIPRLGENGAAQLQKSMTRTILHKATLFSTTHPCSLEIHYTGGSREKMESLYGNSYSYEIQAQGNIGEKMYSALAPKLGRKSSLLLIGSDCPHINEEILEDAFKKLMKCQVVLGPTFDGGYYLIGLRGNMARKTFTSLFENIPWSTGKVFEQTVQILKSDCVEYDTVKKLHDIDTPNELKYLNNYPHPQ